MSVFLKKKPHVSHENHLNKTRKRHMSGKNNPSSSSSSHRDDEENKPVGITVVTGFLGSGKTTLVNHVLTSNHGYKIAVILNEFGTDLGIEKMLVTSNDNNDNGEEGEKKEIDDSNNTNNALVEEWVELDNGCVCCTVKGSLIQTIEKLMEKKKLKEKGAGAKTAAFDYILLETTGLANPGPICGELWVDDALLEDSENAAVLDSVVCVVDAKYIETQLAENVEAQEQIAYADTIVMNKADLVETDEEMRRIREKMESINADAKLVVSERSKVDLSLVLDQKSYKGNVKSRLMETGGGGQSQKFFAKGARDLAMQINASKSSSNVSKHDETISTVCLTAKGIVVKEKFENWIEDLLWEKRNEPNGADVLRCKGILKSSNTSKNSNIGSRGDSKEPPPLVLQGVRDVYEITDGFDGLELQEDGLSKVVLIGRRLRFDELRVGFESCFVV